MEMRIYISGPISGMSDLNLPAFAGAAIKLQLRHPKAVVRNPFDNGVSPDAAWLEHMKADIAMLLECDAVCLLPGWEKSKGANIERQLAYGLCMDVRTLREWLA